MRGFSSGPARLALTWARTVQRLFDVSHFGGVRILLGSGGRGEPAKDGWPPGGLRISGGLGRSTGCQEILHIRKMGDRVGSGRRTPTFRFALSSMKAGILFWE
jgi:hypothetical protein